ncbi:MAG: hypothetical protein GY714_30805 [Desulfobacterales bacterium]|nr:hypothetical protein [Desulfobacterales bacterium]
MTVNSQTVSVPQGMLENKLFKQTSKTADNFFSLSHLTHHHHFSFAEKPENRCIINDQRKQIQGNPTRKQEKLRALKPETQTKTNPTNPNYPFSKSFQLQRTKKVIQRIPHYIHPIPN